MSRFWSPRVHQLTPYTPGEQPKLTDLVKLNTNENPYPPSPKAVAAMAGEIGTDGASLRLYPDPNGDRLKEAIAAHYGEWGLTPRQVFLGNGSDEVLAHVFMALLQQDAPLLFPDITYSFYPVYCGLYGITYRTVPLDGEFGLDPRDYADSPASPVIFPNPNAPTGRLLPLEQIEALAAAHPDRAVVIDEAYIDFAEDARGHIPTAVSLIQRHPNLLVIQTLSKSRSLAGLRVGFALGSEELIEALERVKNSFNSYPLDRIAQAGAQVAMADREWFDRTRHQVMASRERLSAELAKRGFQVLPSAANFVFARHPAWAGADLAQALRQRAIIVRHFQAPRIDPFLRISIGTDTQCDRLLAALDQIGVTAA